MAVQFMLLAAETGALESAASQSALPLMAAVTIFVLAMFVGFEIITKIPPTLHTPLMSGSNAISGITLVGAILAAGAAHEVFFLNLGSGNVLPMQPIHFLGFLAVILATVNVVGGFLVTNRMLEMFRRKD